jgi:hypothetical protein
MCRPLILLKKTVMDLRGMIIFAAGSLLSTILFGGPSPSSAAAATAPSWASQPRGIGWSQRDGSDYKGDLKVTVQLSVLFSAILMDVFGITAHSCNMHSCKVHKRWTLAAPGAAGVDPWCQYWVFLRCGALLTWETIMDGDQATGGYFGLIDR